MIKSLFKGCLTIPNLLSVIRIAMIPVFAVLFYNDQKVIAVGGLTVGGSGKTIVTQFIVNELTKQGKRVAVLSRGYGRKSDKIIRVNPEEHSHKDVGDEPLLLSK